MAAHPNVQTKNLNSAPGVRWISLDQVTEPGAYVCRETGDLVRVPRDGGSSGDGELFDKHGAQPLHVARISSDPFIAITKARFAAAALDIEISF